MKDKKIMKGRTDVSREERTRKKEDRMKRKMKNTGNVCVSV
jgi:hypothetical protein